MSSAASEPGEILDWDSQFWGFRIGRVRSGRLDRHLLAAVDAWSAREVIRCLYLLAGADDVETTRLAEAAGFSLVDVRMSFARSLAQDDATLAQDDASLAQDDATLAEDDASLAKGEAGLAETGATPVRPGGTTRLRPTADGDIPELRRLASTSYCSSRFYVDRRFPRALCDQLYATWIDKSCHGYASAVFVAERDGHADGYITCHLEPGAQVGTIGLVGVQPAARGRGLARQLVNHACTWFRAAGATQVKVVTQGRNLAAQRVYQRAGFLIDDVSLWFHRWTPGPDPAPLSTGPPRCT